MFKWNEINPELPWRSRGWFPVLNRLWFDVKMIARGRCPSCGHKHWWGTFRYSEPMYSVHCIYGIVSNVLSWPKRSLFYLCYGRED